MAIYHYSAKIIGRSSGRSSVAAAAYRSGEDLENERDGERHDYTNKSGVVHSEIIAPENAPEWARDREKLWNEVEKVEKRKDAQTAREFEIALPAEMSREQQIELVRDFAKKHLVGKGMVADIAIHDKEDGNPHAHIMTTMRDLDESGFGKKNRDWNQKPVLEGLRKGWADTANLHLERAGLEERIDHRSLKDQGIDRVPTIHMGVAATAMERRGERSERGDLNRETTEINREIAKTQTAQKEIAAQIEEVGVERPTPAPTQMKVTAGELADELKTQKGQLTQEKYEADTRINEINKTIREMRQPFLKQAADKYFAEKYAKEVESNTKALAAINAEIAEHAKNAPSALAFWKLDAYNERADQLEAARNKIYEQSKNTDEKIKCDRGRALSGDAGSDYDIIRDRQAIGDIADKLANEKTPGILEQIKELREERAILGKTVQAATKTIGHLNGIAKALVTLQPDKVVTIPLKAIAAQIPGLKTIVKLHDFAKQAVELGKSGQQAAQRQPQQPSPGGGGGGGGAPSPKGISILSKIVNGDGGVSITARVPEGMSIDWGMLTAEQIETKMKKLQMERER